MSTNTDALPTAAEVRRELGFASGDTSVFDDPIIDQQIENAAVIVDTEARSDASAQQRRVATRVLAAHRLLARNDDLLVTQLRELDLWEEYDVEGRREQLADQVEQHLAAVRQPSDFEFTV